LPQATERVSLSAEGANGFVVGQPKRSVIAHGGSIRAASDEPARLATALSHET
jgi:hypothetical protein